MSRLGNVIAKEFDVCDAYNGFACSHCQAHVSRREDFIFACQRRCSDVGASLVCHRSVSEEPTVCEDQSKGPTVLPPIHLARFWFGQTSKVAFPNVQVPKPEKAWVNFGALT